MSDVKPPKYIVVFRGSTALLTQHTTVDLAMWDYYGYRVVSSGLWPDVKKLAEELNKPDTNE